MAPHHAPTLQLAGAGVLLYALAAVSWIVYETQDIADTDERVSFKALYDPRQLLPLQAQTQYDWAFLAAAAVVGALALGRLRAARGALALLAAVLLGLGVRELIGLMASDRYRDMITEIGYGKALLTFRIAGLVLACLLWAAVARTRQAAGGAPAHPAAPPRPPYPAAAGHPADAPPPPAYAPYPTYPPYPSHGPYGAPPHGGGPRPVRPGPVVAGLALLLCGVNGLGWLIYTLTRDEIYFIGLSGGYGQDNDAGEFFRTAFDASHGHPLPYTFYYLAVIVLPLAVGALLLGGHRAARGAGVVLALVLVYLDLRGLVPGFDDGFDPYVNTTVGTWALWTSAATILLGAVAALALLSTRTE
ncbi:hypothetical protein [Streptomyces sp. G45]|uniref:hypothetical protein n=1 Tax=Streptomyces sp. G45 TaxID=3406627 RepID=UPI003C17F723